MKNADKIFLAKWLLIVSFVLFCIALPGDIASNNRHNELMRSWNALSDSERESIDQAYSFSSDSLYSGDHGYVEEWQEWKGSSPEDVQFAFSLITVMGMGFALRVIAITPMPRRKRRKVTQTKVAYR